MSDRWWTDGAMVNTGLPGDEGFVGDAATPEDAQRMVDAHNRALQDLSDYLSASEQRRLACTCGHSLNRHTEYGCIDCGTSEASTPMHAFRRVAASPDKGEPRSARDPESPAP